MRKTRSNDSNEIGTAKQEIRIPELRSRVKGRFRDLWQRKKRRRETWQSEEHSRRMTTGTKKQKMCCIDVHHIRAAFVGFATSAHSSNH